MDTGLAIELFALLTESLSLLILSCVFATASLPLIICLRDWKRRLTGNCRGT